MASTTPFFDAIKARRSIYALSNESSISKARIEDIVKFAIMHSPSAFNVQSARAVVMFGDQHRKFWSMAGGHMKEVMGKEAWKGFEKKVKGFEEACGTVLFFEDEDALDALRQKNAMITPLLGQWSAQSAGMHQLITWTALEAEGLGCNLQHYNFLAKVIEDVKKMWGLPESWQLNAQLVFGRPVGAPHTKTFQPIKDRVRVFS